eukprot:jgi/Mesvir1/23955/Mv10724-RA.1
MDSEAADSKAKAPKPRSVIARKPSQGKAGQKTGSLAVKKLTTPVDESLFSQAPAENFAETHAHSTKGGSSPKGGSRFQYDALQDGGAAAQTLPSGHIAAPSDGSDFFADFRTGSGSSTKAPGKPKAVEDNGMAQKKFGTAKSISSDAFFRSEETANEVQERKERLHRFDGASAISSKDYYQGNGAQGDGESLDLGAVDLLKKITSQFTLR